MSKPKKRKKLKRLSNRKKTTNVPGFFDGDKELQEALQYHQSGRCQQAEDAYKKILKVNPEHSKALYLLGILAYQSKKYDPAACLIGKAIQIDPRQPVYYSDMGVVLKEQGDLDQAIVYFQKALQIDPGYAKAYNNMGNALDAQGKPDEAAECYRQALQIDPCLLEAINNLAAILNVQNQPVEAISYCKEALRIKPDCVEAYNNMANALNTQGKSDEAVECYRKALRIEPDNAESCNNLGALLCEQDQVDEAIAYYRKALQSNPRHAQAHYNLANALSSQEKLEEAIACYHKTLQINPNHTEAYNNMGVSLQGLGRSQEAITCFEKTVQLDPGYADAYSNLGESLKKTGHSNEAIGYFQKSLQLDPENVETYKRLSECKKKQPADEAFAVLESLKGKKQHSTNENMIIHFVLGKMYEDIADYEKSFHNYHIGNELRKQCKEQGSDIDNYEEDVRDFIEVFDEDFFASRRHFGIDSDVPIFIVGMPRSGTTLVEQILSSHNQVFGAGELKDISTLLCDLMKQNEEKTFRQFVETLSRDTSINLARQYLNNIRSLSEDACRITDKMPQNFSRLWLITLLFPHAKVIHTRRNPLDTCLSCYFHDFTEGHGYKNDLRTMGHYYRLYEQLMDHWHKVLPISILDVQYEELVRDQEANSRKIVEFCGLEWDDNCLEFHKNKRLVRTASTVQVRKKMYSTSMGRWENYTKFLGPLREALEGKKQEPPLTSDRTSETKKISKTKKQEPLSNCENKETSSGSPPVDIDSELQKAVQYHQSGQIQQAQDIYNEILKVNPRNPDALHLLGIIAYQQKKYDNGADLINKAIQINPGQSIYHSNLGNVLLDQGKPDEAAACYQKALQINPDYAEAYNNLANALNILGRPDEAINCCKKALQLRSDYAQAHNNLANSLEMQDKLDEAAGHYRKAIQLKDNYTEAYNNLGALLYKQDKLDQAIAYYQKAIQLDPNNPKIYNNFGAALYKQGRSEHAKLDHAIACYQKALQLDPDNAEVYNNMGVALNEQGRSDQAIACYQRALELNPLNNDAYNSMGISLKQCGDSDQALICFQKALQIKPDFAEAYKNMADCKKFARGDEAFETLESLKKQPHYSDMEKMFMHFTLAKMYADIADYDQAFHNYQAGNELRKHCKGQDDNIDNCKKHFYQCMEIFDKDFFADRSHFGIDSNLPIFIVGMPRSGTTLIEQILSSHHQVFGAGELKDISLLFDSFVKQNHRKPLAQMVELLDENTSAALAQQYLDRIRSLSESAVHITDKMPNNFERLWFITLLFPHAKIIHARRDPLDTCLSCYFHDFTDKHYYKNDLQTLGQYYRLYEQLMNHWHKVLPIPILDVHYEELIENQEHVSREIIQFCGLDWDVNCLEFHRNERAVRTASAVQVKQKIYKTSAGKWKNYEKHLGPLVKALEDHKQQRPLTKNKARKTVKRIPPPAGEKPAEGSCSFEIDSELKKALQYQQAGQFEQAEDIYRKILKVNPNHPEALHLLGIIAYQFKKYDIAVPLISKAIRIDPNQSAYYSNMGLVLKEQGKLDEAVACLQKAIQLDPDHAKAYNNMGNVLYEQRRPDKAVTCYRKALQLDPKNADALNNLGDALEKVGNSEEAVTYFHKALQLYPENIDAYKRLSSCKKSHPKDKAFEILESLKEKKKNSINDYMTIHFVLGKMYDDIGDYEKSFHNYQVGNQLRQRCKGQDFNISNYEKVILRCLKIFDKNFFAERSHCGVDSEEPIFIVGMPRSGTTLVEQILASHPQVFGAGELQNISMLLNAFARQNSEKTFAQMAASLDENISVKLAGQYLHYVRSLSENATHITDKMPHNFEKLWFINLLFPKAKIIHVCRNPLDTCLSCYFQDFVDPHGYKNDLRTLGRHYRLYERLMDHWREVLPIPILDVQYEVLVEDQEQVSRNIIEFCGLEWDSNCLEFHKNERFVGTVSTTQVRQKIYNTSVGKWKNYEKFLTPLMEALEDAYEPQPV